MAPRPPIARSTLDAQIDVPEQSGENGDSNIAVS